jgi:hypothetical protein
VELVRALLDGGKQGGLSTHNVTSHWEGLHDNVGCKLCFAGSMSL